MTSFIPVYKITTLTTVWQLVLLETVHVIQALLLKLIQIIQALNHLVDIKEENFCFTDNKQSGNPDKIARSHEDVFDTTHEDTAIVISDAEEDVGKNSLLSQIRGFRKETLKQVSPSLKPSSSNLQTKCQVNKNIQSFEFCCESANDQRISTSSRKSSANELVNALTHAIEARAQAMNRSIDSTESDANEEDWDF